MKGSVIAVFSSIAAIAACGTLLDIGADDEPDPAPVSPIGDAGPESPATDGGDRDAPSLATDAGGADADAGVDASPPPCIGSSCPRWVFVTNAAWSGDQIGGTSGADMKCQTAGNAFKPGRQWRALLSDGTSAVASRFVTTEQANYVTGNGLLVAQGWSGFISNMHQKRFFDENGNLPSANDDVWTNTDNAGNPVGEDCFGWTQNMGNGVIGNASATDERWLSNGALGCTFQAHLYCVEQ